jgi:acyl-CoA synthetase (AMP-forming)/AMP-acid ligase II
MSDDPIQLLTDIPRVHGRERGSDVAVHFEGRDLTYAELDRRSDQVAGMLQALGVKPGDRVAWLGRPTEAWYEMFFGVAKARA